MFLLLLPAVAAYQQVYLVFDAPGWDVLEQNSNSQTFSKGSMILDVRAVPSPQVDAQGVADVLGGTLVKESSIGDVKQIIVLTDSEAVLIGITPHQDHAYAISLRGQRTQQVTLEQEALAIYRTLSFSQTPQVTQGPGEEELIPPTAPSFLVLHPIPWDVGVVLIFVLLIAYVVYRKVRKRKKKT